MVQEGRQPAKSRPHPVQAAARDRRADRPEFLEISGDSRVSLEVEGHTREFSHLSSGFASILNLLQAVVSGPPGQRQVQRPRNRLSGHRHRQAGKPL